MLKVSASASSSNAWNRLPCLCFGLEDCTLRGAVAARVGAFGLRDDASKNCCACEMAGLVWLLLESEVLLADLEAEVAALLEMAGDWLDMVMAKDEDGGGFAKSQLRRRLEEWKEWRRQRT